jgi:hypothetical protein
MIRILLIGVWGLAGAGVLMLGVLVVGLRPARPESRAALMVTRPDAQSASEPSVARPPRQGAAGHGWTVTRSLSAHRVMVVEIEAERVDDARRIAIQIVEPLKERYAEILIYAYRRGSEAGLAARRVQWTPRGGYVEVDYEQP